MSSLITVRKLNTANELVWSYTGHVITRAADCIVLEARFNRETSDAGYIVFERGDRFVEYFFADRCYNIFEIHSVRDDHLKGWYCNIVKPAVFDVDVIEQIDLALDLWIYPDGSYLILDREEFDALELDAVTRHHAWLAVNELIYLLYHRATPFTSIDNPRAIEGSPRPSAS